MGSGSQRFWNGLRDSYTMLIKAERKKTACSRGGVHLSWQDLWDLIALSPVTNPFALPAEPSLLGMGLPSGRDSTQNVGVWGCEE